MDKILVKCTVKLEVMIKMFIISSIVLIIPSLGLLFLNIYASALLILIYIIVALIIINTENFCVTGDGIYVCRRNGNIIYGYEFDDIEYVDLIRVDKTIAIKIVTNKSSESKWLVLRDKTKIIVPEYVYNFHLFLVTIQGYIHGKLSEELNEYINANQYSSQI